MTATSFALDALAWLLTYALHSTVLLGAAWWLCSRKRMRSERVRERVWKLALVGGILTAGLQGTLGVKPHGGLFAIESEPAPRTELAAVEHAPAKAALHEELPPGSAAHSRRFPAGTQEPTPVALEPLDFDAPDVLAASPRRAQDGAFLRDESLAAAPPVTAVAAPVDARPTLSSLARLSWTDWALAGWAVGGLVLLILLALAGLRLRDYLAGRTRLREGALFDRLAVLRRAAGIRRPVRLMVSPHIQAPIAMGTLWPEICVPPRAISELTPPMQDAMLAHELAHIARLDPFWLGICRWIETLLFFQPLNRVARRRLAESAEFLCDDRAVAWTRDSLSLARCLAEVAGWLAGEHRPPLASRSLCGMAERHSRLSERVTRILECSGEAEAMGRGLLPIGAGVLASFALLAPGFAREVQVTSRAVAEPDTEVEAALDVEPEQVVTEATPSASPPSRPTLEALVLELEHGLSGLERELESLRQSAADLEVSGALLQRVESVEARASRMRLKKQKIDSLLERLLGGDAAFGIGNSEELQ